MYKTCKVHGYFKYFQWENPKMCKHLSEKGKFSHLIRRKFFELLFVSPQLVTNESLTSMKAAYVSRTMKKHQKWWPILEKEYYQYGFATTHWRWKPQTSRRVHIFAKKGGNDRSCDACTTLQVKILSFTKLVLLWAKKKKKRKVSVQFFGYVAIT